MLKGLFTNCLTSLEVSSPKNSGFRGTGKLGEGGQDINLFMYKINKFGGCSVQWGDYS